VPCLLLATTACGVGSDPDAGNPSTPSAATSSGTTGSVVGKDGDTIEPAEFARELAQSRDGLTSVHMRLVTGGLGVEVSADGQVDYAGDSPAMAVTLSNPSDSQAGRIEAVLVDGVAYLSFGPSIRSGKYLRVGPDDRSSQFYGMRGTLITELDPRRAMEMYSQGIASVVLLGSDELRGQHVDHYKVTADGSALERFLGAKRGGWQLPDENTYEMWVDADYRVHRLEAQVGTRETSLEVFSYETPVDIHAPPPSQVLESPRS
jgi:hypothetical protein